MTILDRIKELSKSRDKTVKEVAIELGLGDTQRADFTKISRLLPRFSRLSVRTWYDWTQKSNSWFGWFS